MQSTVMPTLSREIRVFLSSTFKDMDEERRYLVEHVFPQVRQACAHRHVVFTEIDLRWGITEEEAKNGRTVEICLEEIDRSRSSPPFFIGFLGERYGWIPTEKDLGDYQKKHADSRYVKRITQALKEQISVTELEMQYAFLDEGVDKNHARIFLRSRDLTDSIFQENVQNLAPLVLRDQQNERGKILRCLDDTGKRYKFTHDRPSLIKRLETYKSFYDVADGKLEQLKNKLKSAGHTVMGIDGYTTIQAFGAAVKVFLMDSLDRLYPDQERTALERYLDSQGIYAQSRLLGYLPLAEFSQKVLQAVYQTELDNQVRHLHIYGESGLGKSAFLAHLAKQLEQQNAVVLNHFVGAEALSSPEGWRDQLMSRLVAELEQDENEVPEAGKDAWEVFFEKLGRYQQQVQRPVYLILDALNQMQRLSNLYEHVSALTLPQDVYWITSAIEPYPLNTTHNQELPKLDSNAIKGITQAYLGDYKKTLPSDVIQILATSPACQNSLFLKTLLEELRALGRHETLLAQAQDLLALQTPSKLFQQVLRDIDDYQVQLGLPAIAKNMMQFIGLSYRGLTPHQLKQLLTTSTKQVVQDAHLVPILARLQTFLLNEQGRYRLMHSAFEMESNLDKAQQRQMIVTICDMHTMAGVMEKLFQCLQLKQPKRVTTLLCKHLVSIYREDEGLCRDALILIGALKNAVNQEVNKLIEAIENNYSQLGGGPDDFDNLGGFLKRNFFINLAKASIAKSLEFDRCNEDYFGKSLRLSSSLINMGQFYLDEGRLEKSKSMFLEALDIRQKLLPTGHIEIGKCYVEIGRSYQSIGDLVSAQSYIKKALEDFQFNIQDKAKVMAIMASIYSDQEKFSEAESEYHNALNIQMSIYPEKHENIARTLEGIAINFHRQDNFRNAVKYYKEAIEVFKSVSNQHPLLPRVLAGLARINEEHNFLDKAKICYLEYITMLKAISTEGNASLASGLTSLAALYEKMGVLDDAYNYYLEAIEVYKSLKPHDNIAIASCYFLLAHVDFKKNGINSSESLFKESIDIFKLELPKNLLVVRYLIKSANFYESIKYFNQAESIYIFLIEFFTLL